MVSITSFKSCSMQHDVYFVNYGPVYFKIDNKAGYALGRDYLMINRSLPWRDFMSCSWQCFKTKFRIQIYIINVNNGCNLLTLPLPNMVIPAPKKQDGDGQNPNYGLQNGSYECYVHVLYSLWLNSTKL